MGIKCGCTRSDRVVRMVLNNSKILTGLEQQNNLIKKSATNLSILAWKIDSNPQEVRAKQSQGNAKARQSEAKLDHAPQLFGGRPLFTHSIFWGQVESNPPFSTVSVFFQFVLSICLVGDKHGFQQSQQP